ncbi:MAG TPA: protein translocase subunit SecD [Chloroflexus aurantiacus]|uniref:Protein translocase subunit SecD n=1 Tax=Chloroflexus aurantiacus (strain ATCC 29366 / DSM 635 / J-10-fl) TaxID=324602 RepID=A9WGR0_CHLAA|nr:MULTISPECIES: protein translocase subunit SecD [Chloroflexus]ABY36226.1 protein-export membrane protein SecD [Chloroflexus aurantiacus J-10-fl]RMG45731.1 MAG: protein translocase subunit SecD [Chloroflexota bacterium]GIV94885.1 MAG: protein translocase subunit SecD [Chloroflexus sp.]HBW68978.1 protein translocase subunit SecD [Chloroflexus aurantiacus]
MQNRNILALIITIIATGLALAINFAPNNTFLGRDVSVRLGLDLQGGIQVLLRSADPDATADEIATAARVIEQRVNGLGVGETVVQQAGNNRIIVELPGVANPEQAIETLRGTGRLEFIDSQGEFLADGAIVRTSSSPIPPPQLLESRNITDPTTLGPIYQSITDGADLDTSAVQPTFSQGGTLGSRPAVSFAFRGESAQRLASFTAANVGRPMCIVLDNTVVSCPVINAALTDGSGIIEVSNEDERTRIFNQLKYGALPVPLVVETSRTVTATLGQESVQASITAGIIGLAVVAIFMILFYRGPGLIATVALLIYTIISFAIYRLIPVTLTLPGIAGFILSIGLAVDANVLIFARLREEYRRGRDIRSALELGFVESWPAIRDSSVSTLITSIVLFMFGNSFGVSLIKGFALTLGLGIVVSLFTALVVSRTFLRLVLPLFSDERAWWFGVDRREPSPTVQTAA